MLVLALVPTVALADRTLAPAAKAHLDVGLKAYGAGDYKTAASEIEAAYGIDPDPSLLYTWGQAERFSSHCVKAIDHYRKYLEANPAESVAIATRGYIDLCVETLKREKCEADLHTTQPASVTVIHETGLPWYKNPATGAMIVGVVGLGVGTGFLIAAKGSEDRAHDAPFRDDFVNLLDEATTRRRIGVVTMSISGALAIGGLAYVLTSRPSMGAVTVGANNGGGSLSLSGEF